MKINECMYCLITDNYMSDSTGKTFKLAYCMHDQMVGTYGLPCPHPAKYCIVRHQEDQIKKDGFKQGMAIVR